MEDTLGAIKGNKKHQQCLNPCFNGRYSRSVAKPHKRLICLVLILVLMEDTLGELRLIFLCLSLFEVYLLLAERFS